MNLVKKVKEINIENENFIMAFDMRSIATYKELTGTNFNRGVTKLFQFDDEAIIYFIASTLRRAETPDIPLGKEVIEGDLIYFLINCTMEVINLVAESLPENKSSKKKENLKKM